MQYYNLANVDRLHHRVLNTAVNIDKIHSNFVDPQKSQMPSMEAGVESDVARLLIVECSHLQFCKVSGSAKYCCTNCHIVERYFAQ